ncbi:MAG TPA: hypothetical protein VF635_00085 [Propionibacteriaceae bacterium]
MWSSPRIGLGTARSGSGVDADQSATARRGGTHTTTLGRGHTGAHAVERRSAPSIAWHPVLAAAATRDTHRRPPILGATQSVESWADPAAGNGPGEFVDRTARSSGGRA